jgi:hypothetical protein
VLRQCMHSKPTQQRHDKGGQDNLANQIAIEIATEMVSPEQQDNQVRTVNLEIHRIRIQGMAREQIHLEQPGLEQRALVEQQAPAAQRARAEQQEQEAPTRIHRHMIARECLVTQTEVQRVHRRAHRDQRIEMVLALQEVHHKIQQRIAQEPGKQKEKRINHLQAQETRMINRF